MGTSKRTVEEEVQARYETAFDTLANRCLGEPYNFHRVMSMILPGQLNTTLYPAKIIAACLKQYEARNSYTPQSIALDCGLQAADVLKMAQTDAEMILPDAMDSFLHYHGQWAEMRLAKFVESWIMKGLSSEEIQAEAAKARKEYGLAARLTSSDGKEEFETKLLAAIDGIQFTYPVTPYLKAMRDIVPYYEPGDYIVVAALSGQGKTYDILNQIHHNSLAGVPSCYINLEMTPANVQKRIWQMQCRTHFKSDLRGSDEQMQGYLKAWEEVKAMPFRSYNPGRSLQAVISTIRQDWHERGIQFAAIDYAQKMYVPGYRGARNYELGEISGALRALALELQIPIVVLAQLKQEVAKTNDKRGGMYDIKDCADFTQDATMVQILYRPGYFDITHYETPSGGSDIYPEGYADKFIAKGREIGTGLAKCRFDHIRGFYDAEEPDFAPPGPSTQFPVKNEFNPINVPRGQHGKDDDIPF